MPQYIYTYKPSKATLEGRKYLEIPQNTASIRPLELRPGTNDPIRYPAHNVDLDDLPSSSSRPYQRLEYEALSHTWDS